MWSEIISAAYAEWYDIQFHFLFTDFYTYCRYIECPILLYFHFSMFIIHLKLFLLTKLQWKMYLKNTNASTYVYIFWNIKHDSSQKLLGKNHYEFLWALTKKTNSLLYSSTNDRIDKMVTIVNFLKTHHYIANGCVLCH